MKQEEAMREKYLAGIVERESPSPKKQQVRRRLHTRKPYQEKFLNMAEARREIVTALKIHRASKKHKTTQSTSSPPPPPPPNNNNNSFFNYYYNFQPNDDFVLPDQTLGLNLNLDDFPSIYYSPSTSSSSPPPPPPPPSAAPEVEFVKPELAFDEGMEEFPAWLAELELHQLHHHFLDPAAAQPALPCMDIEEIEGIDGDWLA